MSENYHESIVSVADVERFIESIDLISKAIHWNATEKGFWEGDQDNDGLKIALIHSELSELLEGIREGNPESKKISGFSNAEEEGADILIRLCDLFKKRGWRLGEATIAKMLYNSGRPYKHGKEF